MAEAVKKNDTDIYQDAARQYVEKVLMDIRRARLHSPLSSETQAVYVVLCEVSRRMVTP